MGQSWVVDPDPDHVSVDVYDNVAGAWELALHLDDAHPAGEVTVGEYGVLALDLGSILQR